MTALFDTRRVDKSDRRDYWLETVCRNILPVDFDPRLDAQPQAAMACTTVGPMSIRQVVGGNHVYVRDKEHVRRSDPESFQVGIPTKGASILTQDGSEARLEPGDMVLWDSSRPYTLVMAERFHWHVFLLPKQKLRRPDAELRRLVARPIRAGTGGVPAVVSHFLLDLANRAPQLEGDPAAAALGEAAGDLVATLVVQSEFGLPWSVGRPDDVLRDRVRYFIAEHQHDPSLGPTEIAAAAGVSVRTLHQLFPGCDETVMDCVRRTRLAAIRRDVRCGACGGRAGRRRRRHLVVAAELDDLPRCAGSSTAPLWPATVSSSAATRPVAPGAAAAGADVVQVGRPGRRQPRSLARGRAGE